MEQTYKIFHHNYVGYNNTTKISLFVTLFLQYHCRIILVYNFAFMKPSMNYLVCLLLESIENIERKAQNVGSTCNIDST